MFFDEAMRELPVSTEFTWLAMEFVDAVDPCFTSSVPEHT
jgi:hypothetical protein